MTNLNGYIFFLLMLSFLGSSVDLFGQEPEVLKRICIDPGHGGKDPGAVAGKVKEKDITLAVALKLGELIRKSYPDMEIVYTRNKDVAVDLQDRGKIANKARAQLFISIHCNYFKKSTVKGVETFVLGLHKSEASLEVAMKENQAIHYEEDYSIKYDGFDPQQPESYILFNLMKNAFLVNSLEFATPVQNALVKDMKMNNREVKQAGFIVLMNVAMPAVLIETGFISNPDDLKVLNSAAGQQKIAQSIFKGFVAYKDKMERNSVVIRNMPEKQTAEKTQEPVGETKAKAETKTGTKTETKAKANNIRFAIQVASVQNRMNDTRKINVKEKVEELKVGNRYCYYVCPCNSYEEATAALTRVKKTVKDCFIIAICNGQLIPVSEARKIINEK